MYHIKEDQRSIRSGEMIYEGLVKLIRAVIGAFYGLEGDYVDYIVALRIGGTTNVLTHWIETGKKRAPDELAERLRVIVSNIGALEQLL
jgi:hypothetical protein